MSDLIEPRVLKGFRDLMPEKELMRRSIIRRLEHTFQNFGFVPIDTPVLEYSNILLGKGGGETDKQMYRFLDGGKRDVALRFDLTVPFARYMAAHGRELPVPFRRYHTAKAWRGENTQRGRYREFMQCDFDIVGVDTLSADLEIILLIRQCFEILGIKDIVIAISHRGVFNRLLHALSVSDRQSDILRLVDKKSKIGVDNVRIALKELVPDGTAATILKFIEKGKTSKETLENMENKAGGPGEDTRRLCKLFELFSELEIDRIELDPSITRGLDYYTGLVFETYLVDLPEIGSVCSGGRYNDLASLYSKRQYPGVGASIGVDRLMAALEERGFDIVTRSIPEVLILNLGSELTGHYYKLGQKLRQHGISCEIYYEKRKLAQQFQYAEKKSIPVGIICGEDEHAKGVVSVKNLATRDSHNDLTLDQAAEKIREIIKNRNGGRVEV